MTTGGMMTPKLLRQIWGVLEATQGHQLLPLDDASLVQWVLGQLANIHPLSDDEVDVCGHYIRSKVSLIRDLALQK